MFRQRLDRTCSECAAARPVDMRFAKRHNPACNFYVCHDFKVLALHFKKYPEDVTVLFTLKYLETRGRAQG